MVLGPHFGPYFGISFGSLLGPFLYNYCSRQGNTTFSNMIKILTKNIVFLLIFSI